MFYLAGNDFPRSALEMESSLRESLQQFFRVSANENLTVRIEGGNYPEVNCVGIDLSGTNIEVDRIPPRPAGVGQSRPGLHTLRLEVSGHTIRVQDAAVHLDLTAADVQFDYDRDKAGRPLLLLVAAGKGDIEVKISHADLETIFLALAKAAAARQGIVVEKVALELVPIDHRSLAMTIRLTAKKLFVRATLEVKGQVEVDDELNARLSNLSCEGEGPMGILTGNLLRPHLERFDQREIPLTAIPLGNVHLQDLQIKVSSFLEVTAAFGG